MENRQIVYIRCGVTRIDCADIFFIKQVFYFKLYCLAISSVDEEDKEKERRWSSILNAKDVRRNLIARWERSGSTSRHGDRILRDPSSARVAEKERWTRSS
jgi:hypothetical protein